MATGEYKYESADFSPVYSADKFYGVHGFVREYDVLNSGRMYCLSNNTTDLLNDSGAIIDWQQGNTVWTLKNDLPVYLMDGATLSDRVLKAGSKVIVRGVSANGFLYVCGEEGDDGVIRVIWPQVCGEDPYAAPGGRRMTYFFLHYDMYSGADDE